MAKVIMSNSKNFLREVTALFTLGVEKVSVSPVFAAGVLTGVELEW